LAPCIVTTLRTQVNAYRQRWNAGLNAVEREAIDAYLRLPAARRKVLREVILTFARVSELEAGSS
jgi:predicted Zn-dependent protease with MMP-like domain